MQPSTRRKSDWTCDTCSAPPSQQSPPPTVSPAPPTVQISDDSTFNVLQLNANGIGNKADRTMSSAGEVYGQSGGDTGVKAITQNPRTPVSRTTPLCVRIVSHGQGGGLLIFIHRSITFCCCCLPRPGPSSSQSRFPLSR